MRHLFIRLYLDEDVNLLLADLLRARGFQVTTTREAGQIGKSDGEQLAFASSREQAILTHNRVDFEALGRQYFEEGWPFRNYHRRSPASHGTVASDLGATEPCCRGRDRESNTLHLMAGGAYPCSAGGDDIVLHVVATCELTRKHSSVLVAVFYADHPRYACYRNSSAAWRA